MTCESCRRTVKELKEILIMDNATRIRFKRCEDCFQILEKQWAQMYNAKAS